MTLRDDIITDAAATIFETDDLAQEGTYRAKGSAVDVDVTVLLDQIRAAESSSSARGEAYYAYQGHLWCQVVQVVAPGPGDTFTVGSHTWIVQEIMGGNAAAWELLVYRSAFAGKIR